MGLSKTAKIMIISAAAICLVFLAAGLIVINLVEAVAEIETGLPFAAGILLGCAVTAVKIIMLEKAINTALDLGEKGSKSKAGPVGSLLYLLRFILTVAALAAAFIFPHVIGRIGMILGILSMQLSAYSANIFLKRLKPDNFGRLNDLSDDDEEEETDGEDGEKNKNKNKKNEFDKLI